MQRAEAEWIGEGGYALRKFGDGSRYDAAPAGVV